MVTSDGLISINPLLYQQDFNAFLPDTFSHENDLLTRALHTTVSSPSTPFYSTFSDSSAASLPSSSTPSLSSNNSLGSDPVIIGAKRKGNCHLTQGKTTKHRSRPSKKSLTTFITADPENFRQMVQQVTGAKSVYETFTSTLKPKLNNRLPCGPSNRYSSFPMLDTSSFLSNLQSPEPNAAVKEGASAFEFDNYPIFPTLESWKVT